MEYHRRARGAHGGRCGNARAKNATARDTADANDLLDSAIRTIATCGQGAEDRLAYLRRFKCKKALTGEERVAERLVYSRFFDTTAAERSNDGVDASSTPWTTTDSRSASTRRPRRRPPRSSKSAAAEGAEAAAAATSASRSRRQRPEHADRATKERADKNKDKDKIKGKPQPGNPARKTTTPRTEEQN
eukprot:jgi/Tetstr1/453273/TSEL_003955.t1